MPKIAISPTKTKLPGLAVSTSPVGDMDMDMDMDWGNESGGSTITTTPTATITNGGSIITTAPTVTITGDDSITTPTATVNEESPIVVDPLVLDVKLKNYTLDTEFTFLTMNRMDNTITVTPNGTQSYIDGDAGLDTLVLKSTADQFVLQNDADGNTLVSSVDGSFNIAATDVELLKFSDKVIDLNDVDEILTLASDLPTVEQAAPTADSLLVSHWMANPFDPFPTTQFVSLVFDRIFKQPLDNAQAQYWNNFVSDFIQQPGQLAQLTGLIHENEAALFV